MSKNMMTKYQEMNLVKKILNQVSQKLKRDQEEDNNNRNSHNQKLT